MALALRRIHERMIDRSALRLVALTSQTTISPHTTREIVSAENSLSSSRRSGPGGPQNRWHVVGSLNGFTDAMNAGMDGKHAVASFAGSSCAKEHGQFKNHSDYHEPKTASAGAPAHQRCYSITGNHGFRSDLQEHLADSA